MINVEELMLGDQVIIKERDISEKAIYGTVIGIDRKISTEPYTIGYLYTYYDDQGKEHKSLSSCGIDRVLPISLTPELLEDLGFVRERSMVWDLYRHKDHKWLVLYKKEHGFTLHLGEGEIKVEYLHILQHLLKL